jgi:hypothetical protein
MEGNIDVRVNNLMTEMPPTLFATKFPRILLMSQQNMLPWWPGQDQKRCGEFPHLCNRAFTMLMERENRVGITLKCRAHDSSVPKWMADGHKTNNQKKNTVSLCNWWLSSGNGCLLASWWTWWKWNKCQWSASLGRRNTWEHE